MGRLGTQSTRGKKYGIFHDGFGLLRLKSNSCDDLFGVLLGRGLYLYSRQVDLYEVVQRLKDQHAPAKSTVAGSVYK